MYIFYYTLMVAIPLVTYKWINCNAYTLQFNNIVKYINSDTYEKNNIVNRFHKSDTYLNNLINYEYFNAMCKYYKSNIQQLNNNKL